MAIKIDYNRLFYEPEALDMKNYPKVDDNWSIDFYDILADQEKKRYQELANNKLEEDEVERQALKEEFALLPQDAEVGDIIGAIERAGQRSAALGGGIDLTWKAIQRRDDQEYRDAMSRYREREKVTWREDENGNLVQISEEGPTGVKIPGFGKKAGTKAPKIKQTLVRDPKTGKSYWFRGENPELEAVDHGLVPIPSNSFEAGEARESNPGVWTGKTEARKNVEKESSASSTKSQTKPSLWNRLFGGGRGRRLEKIPEN